MIGSVSEPSVDLDRFIAEIGQIAKRYEVTAALVVLFTATEYKSFHYNCADEEFDYATRAIKAHKRKTFTEH